VFRSLQAVSAGVVSGAKYNHLSAVSASSQRTL
jgi:hypothetical protein